MNFPPAEPQRTHVPSSPEEMNELERLVRVKFLAMLARAKMPPREADIRVARDGPDVLVLVMSRTKRVRDVLCAGDPDHTLSVSKFGG